jgi:LEA14-like dessication related protein
MTVTSVRCGAVALALLLAGCAGIPLERPRVNIANVTVKEVKLLEQLYDLELRILNPNDSDLIINGLAFDILINDKNFASGTSGRSLTIPRFSTGLMTVEAVSPLASILRQLSAAQKTGLARVTYRLRGAVYVGSPSLRLGFDEQGELELPIPKNP